MKSSTFDLGLLVLIIVDGLEKTLTHGKQKGRFTLDQESMGPDQSNLNTRLYFLTYDIHYCFYMLLPAIKKEDQSTETKIITTFMEILFVKEIYFHFFRQNEQA